MDEITWEAGSRVVVPSAVTLTATARPPSRWTAVALVAIRTSPPWATTFSVQRSHIIPGPNFGYSNSSMRLVTCFDLSRRLPASDDRIGSQTAFHIDMPLIRCAPPSAEISDAETPQTFSL